MGSVSTKATLYFGFGSNLWLHQMQERCPTSSYLGVARLDEYRWIINERGYANVVEVEVNKSISTSTSTADYSSTVFGLVYSLQPADEARLDKNEGVPVAYTKEYLHTAFWVSENGKWVDVGKQPTKEVDMLVYIDRKRTTVDKPREEYVYRMNRGIEDAVVKGVPEAYVREVMRKFIPAEGGEGEGKATGIRVQENARRQAKGFKDESGVF